MDQEKALQSDSCQEQSNCELFTSGQCDGSSPCPKAESQR